MDLEPIRKHKDSRQRNLILKIVRSTHCHPSADWIFEQARKSIPNISLGTVYRNLRLLSREGKIQEVSFSDGVNRYDGDMRNHHHIRCKYCECVEDVPHVSQTFPLEQIEQITGYRIYSMRLEFLGVCPACKNNEEESPLG